MTEDIEGSIAWLATMLGKAWEPKPRTAPETVDPTAIQDDTVVSCPTQTPRVTQQDAAAIPFTPAA